jgi:excisionase family DNA binding protein
MSDSIKPITVSVQECARIIGISRSMIYEAIGDGELDAIKDGGRTLITMASIERRQAALPRAKIKPYRRRPTRARSEATKVA